MLTSRLKYVMTGSARRPFVALAVVGLLTLAAIAYAVTAFDMNTDTGALISPTIEWRQNEGAVEAAFPQLNDAIVVVVDARTPELASYAAAKLTAALAKDRHHFALVRQADGGDYFDRQGLLFGSVRDIQATTARLIEVQPLLGGLASDPSLHGIAAALETAASSTIADTDLERLRQPLAKLDGAIETAMSGKAAYFSWQQLFSPANGGLAPSLRRLILAEPKLDFGAIQPGAGAIGAVRAEAAALRLDAARGITVGVTGETPLADEEFQTLQENIGLVGVLMVAAMLVTLWFATRSVRTVLAIVITITVGLAITLAAGLLVTGALNLISVAFIPLFVGLGVDFGIQVSVRFNAERLAGAAPLEALERAAAAIGAPLLLAAAAIFLGFGAFLPTAYVGIAELGVISGIGMIVALALNVTLLPALLILLRPPVPIGEVGFSRAAPVDRWLENNRRKILGAFAAAMLASIALLPWVEFDFNPLHLRNPQAPAMRLLADLMRDPQRTPNTISVLAPNIDAANRLATRLAKLPEVEQAITIDDFVPADQPAKLALIEDASLLLDATVNPLDMAAPSSDRATVAALAAASLRLKALADEFPGAPGDVARHLSQTLTRLAEASPDVRRRVESMLVAPLNVTLDKIRASLQPRATSRQTLPPEIAADWIARDGRALIQVFPRGNSNDNGVLAHFTAAVRRIAPGATGLPVATQEAAHTVSTAFIQAGVLALAMVTLLLYAVLRSLREVAFTLAPVVLSGFLTLATCVLIGQPLNFANIIAFPLLFGVGVAFHIYFVMAWRSGTRDLLQTPLARAVLFSALATGSAFGALWFSDHPGTSSMGLILVISLIWTLVCALIFEPALLGPVRQTRHSEGARASSRN